VSRPRDCNAAPGGLDVSEFVMRTSIRALALVAVSLISLTACAKPAPSVTVFSSANSVHAEAVCWDADCSQERITSALAGVEIATLAVTPGRTIGISVDSEVAEAGWQPAIIVNGQAQTLEQNVIHKRYWRMTFPESTRGSFPAAGFSLQIVSNPTADGHRGAWFFTLTDAETTNNA
jgi:hypothetical protein